MFFEPAGWPGWFGSEIGRQVGDKNVVAGVPFPALDQLDDAERQQRNPDGHQYLSLSVLFVGAVVHGLSLCRWSVRTEAAIILVKYIVARIARVVPRQGAPGRGAQPYSGHGAPAGQFQRSGRRRVFVERSDAEQVAFFYLIVG